MAASLDVTGAVRPKMIDPITDRIDRLKANTERLFREEKRRYAESAVGKIHKEISAWAIFWTQFARGWHWFYSWIVAPIARPLFRLARWAWGRYRALWSAIVYLKDEHGVLRFSKTRAGAMVTATVACIYLASHVIELFWHTGLYAVTADRGETVYLISSQEIFPELNIHNVKGCESLPCTEQNSIYFRVRPTTFNHIWSLVNHSTIFFPDYVAAAAPQGIAKCSITSYGVRWKFVMRVIQDVDFYPDILAISCEQRSGT